MLYLLLEIDPGDVSPYDLMWDQRIINEVSEIGAQYPVKIMIVKPGPETIAMFDNQQPVEPKEESVTLKDAGFGGQDITYETDEYPVTYPTDDQ